MAAPDHSFGYDDLAGLSDRRVTALAARHALRLLATLRPTGRDPGDASELIRAVEVCDWGAATAAYGEPDGVRASLLRAALGEARARVEALTGPAVPEQSKREAMEAAAPPGPDRAPAAAAALDASGAALLALARATAEDVAVELASEPGSSEPVELAYRALEAGRDPATLERAAVEDPDVVADTLAGLLRADLSHLAGMETPALTPLWGPEPPQRLLERWQKTLAGLELDEVRKRYTSLLEGNVDWDYTAGWLERWGREQDVTPVAEESEVPRDAESNVRGSVGRETVGPDERELVGPDEREPVGPEESPAEGPDTPRLRPVGPGRPFVDNDALPEHDSLNVRDQARTFARLLTARDVVMPISIGLFGMWGVGKTFFMHLIDSAVQARTAGQDVDDAESPYVRRVAQIHFNAWHYVDTNLWASLAVRLFEGLVTAYDPEAPGDRATAEARRRELRAQVASNEQARTEAQEQQRDAQEDRKDAARELESLRARRAAAARDFGTVYWNALKGRVVRDGELDLDGVQAAARRLGLLGRKESLQTVEEVRELYGQLSELQGRWRALGMWLGQRFGSPARATTTVAVIALVLAVAIASGPAAGWLLDQLGLDLQAAWEGLVERATQVAALVAPAVAWASRQMGHISDATRTLERVQVEIDATDPDGVLATLEAEQRAKRDELDRLDGEIRARQERIDAADRRIREAQAELQRIDSGGLVYDFLTERREDPEYRSRLGVISVIRNDFEHLRELLDDWNERQPPGRAPIERIILYIDDLDRCHPDQVVEVLQAVHLLLAFDLFAVVVAVDPRWLERSLYRAYVPDLLHDQLREGRTRQDDFSPQNYLEKIFQIPFSLDSLRPEGYRSLVDDMVVTRSEAEARASAGDGRGAPASAAPGTPRPAEDGGTPGTAEDVEAPEDAKTPETVEDAGAPETVEAAGAPGTVEKESVGPTDVAPDRAEPAEPMDAVEPVEAPHRAGAAQAADAGEPAGGVGAPPSHAEAAGEAPEPVLPDEQQGPLLEDWEERFLQTLHPFVSTPRLAKRLVNIYRLLRVRAGDLYDDFDAFIDPTTGEYRHALVLLAMNIGHPEVAGTLLRRVATTREESLDALIYAQWQQVAEHADDGGVPWALRQQDSLRRLARNLNRTRRTLEEGDAEVPFPEELEPLRTWAPEVGRYSFHWNLA